MEIGVIEYSFVADIWYHEGNYSIDPTEGEEEELEDVELREIVAFNTETEKDWKVTDQSEIQMVTDWFADLAMDYKNGWLI